MPQVAMYIREDAHKRLLKEAAQRQLETEKIVSVAKIASEYFHKAFDTESSQTVSQTVSTENVQETPIETSPEASPEPETVNIPETETVETTPEEPIEEHTGEEINSSNLDLSNFDF